MIRVIFFELINIETVPSQFEQDWGRRWCFEDWPGNSLSPCPVNLNRDGDGEDISRINREIPYPRTRSIWTESPSPYPQMPSLNSYHYGTWKENHQGTISRNHFEWKALITSSVYDCKWKLITEYWYKKLEDNWPVWQTAAKKIEINHWLTVPSRIFSRACWTPSPDTSLLMFWLSAYKLNITELRNAFVSFSFYIKEMYSEFTRPFLLSCQLRQYTLSLAELFGHWSQQPKQGQI